jgi:hypothetical protein
VVRSVGGTIEREEGGARLPTRPGRRPGLALGAVLLLGLAPPGLAAQQDSTRAGPPGPAAAASDTITADTIPADTLSPRQRALRRLRALPETPIQPDTTDADSAAADSVAGGAPAADSVGEVAVLDTTAAGAPGAEPPRQGPDSLAVPVPVAGVPLTPVAPGRDSVEGSDEMISEDSVLAQLQRMPGYQVTEYRGETAVFEAETNQLELTGASRIGRQSNALETDSLLVYDGEAGVVCGYGTPVLSGEAEPVESDEICFDIDRELGVARGARTTFSQGATWYVRGADNEVYVLSEDERDTVYGSAAEFTSCELDHPHYTFRARSVKMREDDVMVARDVTLRFEDVPVFWLPWMVQSMKQDRRSGLLMPEFGLNDIVRNSTGYERRLSNLGFYWAMNDYMSTKATFEWYSGNWKALEGGLTYRWLRQFLSGNLAVKHYWREQEGLGSSRELTLNTSNNWQPNERTRINLNANYASSTDFVTRNSFDPRELNRSITSAGSINRTFDWGSVSLGADRRQQLSTGQVNTTLPSLNLSLTPITLFSAGQGRELVWNGSGSVSRRLREVSDTILSQRDQEARSAQASHNLSLGNFRLAQSANWTESVDALKEVTPDSVLPERVDARLGWSTSLSYQLPLWTGTTVNPNVSINGSQVRNAVTDSVLRQLAGDPAANVDRMVAEPTRISAGASLNTALYGFLPGFGPYSRIRHKISPTLSWAYSPAPETTPLQDSVFRLNPATLRESNTLTLSFNQTFEAKKRESETDTAAVDTLASATGEPRRLPQAEKVLLLGLNTSTSFIYDFVSAREEGRGFLTNTISNSIRSDLLDGLQLSVTHDLFRGDEGAVAPDGALAPRTFDPYLTNLRTSFSIDSDFWLFRVLGLSATRVVEPEPGTRDPEAEGVAGPEDTMVGAEADPDQGPGGSIVPNRGLDDTGSRRTGVGTWNARLNYSLQRSRPTATGIQREANQLVRGDISFEPTELWRVSWSTSYSVTDGEFADHVLRLSRDLHRWTANFDFIKAQNGNFAMQFRVQLRDNPDLKVDYDQRDYDQRTGLSQPGAQ